MVSGESREMKQYKCDNCGTIIEDISEVYRITVLIVPMNVAEAKNVTRDDAHRLASVDWCEACCVSQSIAKHPTRVRLLKKRGLWQEPPSSTSFADLMKLIFGISDEKAGQ